MKKYLKVIIPVLVVIVGVISAVVIPKIIDNYKFEETFKNNLNMLAQAKEDNQNDYISNIENDNIDGDVPLTFSIEEIYGEGETWKSVEYKIVPSYNKDFSKWTKADKEAYNKTCEEANARAEALHNSEVQKEKDEMLAIEKMLNEQMANQWEKREYEDVGVIEYNINTALTRGSLMGQAFDTTYEDFIDTVGTGILASMHSIIDYGKEADGSYSGLTEEQWHILDAMTFLENLIENMKRIVILKNTPDGEDPPF